jgi:radical SAM superfamily enzyme YgiQ (UPF0313 family)
MPITDTDQVLVRRVSRQQRTNIEIEIEWFDSAGNSRGTFGISWTNEEDLRKFLEGQDFDDVVRALMVAVLNRTTGGLRLVEFDALPGKRFEIQQRTREV